MQTLYPAGPVVVVGTPGIEQPGKVRAGPGLGVVDAPSYDEATGCSSPLLPGGRLGRPSLSCGHASLRFALCLVVSVTRCSGDPPGAPGNSESCAWPMWSANSGKSPCREFCITGVKPGKTHPVDCTPGSALSQRISGGAGRGLSPTRAPTCSPV